MVEGHIWIDGVITDDYHTIVNKQLRANSNADIIVLHIQSPGGSVYAGYNTYHLLKSSGKRIKSIIEGEAQSIATLIALAGDTIEIRKPSVFMIHNPFAGIEGDADKMINGASELRQIEQNMAEIYSAKTNIPIDQIKQMMKKETAMSSTQAVQMGFADREIDPLKMVAIGKSKIQMEEKDTKTLFEEFSEKLNKIYNQVFGEEPQAAAPGIEAAPIQEAPKQQALPAGEYPLQDGRVIVVDESGMITEVKGQTTQAPEAPPAPEPNPMEQALAQIQSQLDEMKKKYSESEAKAEGAVKALAEVKTLLKEPLGNTKAPQAAAVFTKEPISGGDDFESQARNEIFAMAGIDQLIKSKKK